MLKKVFALSLPAFVCLSGAITNFTNPANPAAWNFGSNWSVAVPSQFDNARFPAGSVWYPQIDLNIDANVGSITFLGNTTLTSIGTERLNLYPTSSAPVAMLVDSDTNFDNTQVYFWDSGKVIVNGTLSINSTMSGEWFTYGTNTAGAHAIEVENNNLIKLSTANLFTGNGPFTPNFFVDSVTITGGAIDSADSQIFSQIKQGALDTVNCKLGKSNILGFFTGTLTLNDSLVDIQNPGTITIVSFLTQNKMVLDGASHINDQQTVSGTVFIGPGPIEMLTGTINNNSYMFVDKINLNFLLPGFERAPQTSLFSGGTIESSLLTGSTWVAGTAIFNNYVEQNAIVVGEGLDPATIIPFIAGSISFPSFQAAEAFMYANGDINSDISVVGSGTLLGDGTITGDVNIGKFAKLNPGNPGSPGTLSIFGDLFVGANAAVTMDFSSSGYDSVQIFNGSMSIDTIFAPTLTLTLTGSPPQGTYFPLFEVFGGGTIGGSFTVAIPPGLSEYVYNQTETAIFLSFTPPPSGTCAQTPNQIEVQRVLNLLSGNTNECLQNKIDLLNAQTCPVVRSILDSLEPSEFKGQQLANEEVIFEVNSELLSRLYNRKKGFRPFLQAGYRRLNQNSYSQYSGFHTNAGYQLLGFSQGFDNSQVIGAIGAAEIYNTYKKSSSNSSTAQLLLNLGVSGFSEHFQFSADGLFAANYNHTSRHMPFYGLKARSNHQGFAAKAAFDLRYRFLSDDGEITPYDTFSYLYDHESGYTENGADCLNLQVGGSSRQTLRNEAGLHFAAKLRDRMKPYLDLAYVYEDRRGGKKYTTQFVSTDQKMIIEGLSTSKNFVKLAFGMIGYQGNVGYKINLDGMYSDKLKQIGGSLAIDRKF